MRRGCAEGCADRRRRGCAEGSPNPSRRVVCAEVAPKAPKTPKAPKAPKAPRAPRAPSLATESSECAECAKCAECVECAECTKPRAKRADMPICRYAGLSYSPLGLHNQRSTRGCEGRGSSLRLRLDRTTNSTRGLMVPKAALPLYMLHGMLQGASSPHTFGLQRSFDPGIFSSKNVQIHFYMKKSFNGAISVFEILSVTHMMLNILEKH